MCFDFLYKFLSEEISHSEKNWSKIWSKMYIGLHVNYRLYLSDFNETWNVSTLYRKIFKYQISWKTVQCEPSCSMRTDWRTDGRTWPSLESLYAILRKDPKNESTITREKYFPSIKLIKCFEILKSAASDENDSYWSPDDRPFPLWQEYLQIKILSFWLPTTRM